MITDAAATPTLDAMVEEYYRLKQAATLLEEVYTAIGPYPMKDKGSLNGVSYLEEPWNKVRDFFGFDDSE